jgi:hypothetical protein
MQPTEFGFVVQGLEDREYRVFPESVDRDPLTWFHGASEENIRSILQEGFVIPALRPNAHANALKSISFAKRSATALQYACEARDGLKGNGGILAVRFSNLDDVTVLTDVLHVARADRMPTITQFCIIPASYRFV